MKKIIISIITFVIIIGIAIIIINKQDKSNLKKVTLAEVTHSIFYTPQYVADALGYFEDEGIDLEIILTPGADKVTASVLSGDADIGFCGSEATIYVYNGGEKDYLVNFAGLTKRDGSFLVSRKKITNFNINDVENSYIIGGRQGGMPLMTLKYALEQNGVNLNKTTIDTSIEFSAMAGAFISGTGDYVALFEPQALEVEKNGYGYVVASIGELGGVVPYTAYNAKSSYIASNKETIKGFTKAIQKGLNYVFNNTSKDLAKIIKPYFPDTNINDLESIIERYRKNDSWFKSTIIKEDDFYHVQEIMDYNKVLDKLAPYKKLVNTNF